jgi:uncharacterized protein
MGVLLLNYLILLILVCLNSCSHLFFQPSRYLYSRPEDLKLNYENRVFDSEDNTRLHSWYFPAEGQSKGLVVLFHGNAQNLSAHYLAVSWMVRYHYDVWVWDYRGYGMSQGEAENDGVYKDTLAALNYVKGMMKERENKKLILIGQSLGGNLLMKALEDNPLEPNLIVLDSTFLSYKKLAKDKLASVWFLWPIQYLSYALISDEFSPQDQLAKIKAPTLVIHGKKDEVVPFSYGDELFRSLNPSQKWFWEIEDGTHISVLGTGKDGYDEKLIELIETL